MGEETVVASTLHFQLPSNYPFFFFFYLKLGFAGMLTSLCTVFKLMI